MARGNRLALMDGVGNTRDFAGEEQFQVAKQLWKTLYNIGANIFGKQSVCARHITGVILLNSPKKPGEVGMISTFLRKIRGSVRTQEVRSLAQGPVDWGGEVQNEHTQPDIKACVLQTKPICRSINAVCKVE